MVSSDLNAILKHNIETFQLFNKVMKLYTNELFQESGKSLLYINFFGFLVQIKYKEDGKYENTSSLYHLMPDTMQTQFAREVTDLQSEVNLALSSLFSLSLSLFLFLSLSHPPNKSRCYKILRERCQKTDISQLCSSKAAGVFLLLSYYCRKLIRQAVRRSVKSNLLFQVKYKEKGKNNASSSIYSQLPETTETQFAKQMSELQSEVSLHL